MAKVISLVNQKGGVGKTTSSINLAACLSIAEKKTLLIDLDPQGNASVGVGLDKEVFEDSNIYHALIGQVPITEGVYKSELPFLDICPSDTNLVGAEIELVGAMARESKLKSCIAPLLDMYDYILIDCPPSLGLLTINSLTASNGFIVPLQTEYFAMEGLAQLLKTVETIKGSLNEDLDLVGVLLTLFDSRNNLHKQVSAEIRKHFGPKVFNSVIPRNVKLSECPSFGKPIILYDIESRGSEAYLSLAKEILLMERGHVIEEPTPEVTEEVVEETREAIEEVVNEPVQELKEETTEEVVEPVEERTEEITQLVRVLKEEITEPVQEFKEESIVEVEIPPVIEETPVPVFTEKTENIETTKHS
jgi:chromosome partitioning protein